MKACLVELNRDIHSSKLDDKFDFFVQKFVHIQIVRKVFKERLKRFCCQSWKEKWDQENKDEFLSIFGGKALQNLPS